MPLLTNYFYQYFKSNQSVQLQTELKQTKLRKPDAYKNINSSSVQIYTNKLT
jgi:hypothetical protein